MSRGCYEETAVVEFRLDAAGFQCCEFQRECETYREFSEQRTRSEIRECRKAAFTTRIARVLMSWFHVHEKHAIILHRETIAHETAALVQTAKYASAMHFRIRGLRVQKFSTRTRTRTRPAGMPITGHTCRLVVGFCHRSRIHSKRQKVIV